MPRKAKAVLSQPLFQEPVFNEGIATPDPSQFTVTPNDTQFYTSQVNALLKTEVVSFPKASGNPSDVFPLQTAWGPHGPDVINAINAAQSVTFQMIGDSGHNVTSLVQASFGKTPTEPGNNIDVSYLDSSSILKPTTLTLNKHDQKNSGYLRVSVTAKQLTITFNPVSPSAAPTTPDTVTVDLASHTAK